MRALRSSAPFTVSVVAALVVALAAGTSAPEPRPVPAAVAPVGNGPAEGDLVDLGVSRDVPLPQVRDHYLEVAREQAPIRRVRDFMPLYAEAQRVFGVDWHLIASIHRQETAFSASKTTYHGLNFAGCCAGPMQFNVTNGPVSTWERYRNAFKQGDRPASYFHRTAKHPSIYDDFDAIMAAGMLLRDSGAGAKLDGTAWTAAYAYYGHDLFGITYANTVLARALGWVRDGFCVNCLVDEGLIARQERLFGSHERAVLGDTSAQEAKLAKQRRKAAKRRKAKRVKARRREAAQAREARVEATEEAKRRAGRLGQKTGRGGDTAARRPAPTTTPAPARTPAKPARTPRPTATPAPTETTPPTATATPDIVQGILGGGGDPSAAATPSAGPTG